MPAAASSCATCHQKQGIFLTLQLAYFASTKGQFAHNESIQACSKPSSDPKKIEAPATSYLSNFHLAAGYLCRLSTFAIYSFCTNKPRKLNTFSHKQLNQLLPPFNISRNIDFQPGFLKIGWTKINFDNGFEFLRSFSWFAIVFVLALK